MDKLEKALEKARQQRNEISEVPRACAMPSARSSTTSKTCKLSENKLEENNIIAHRPHCKEADVIRLLRTQVLQAMNKENHRTLAITSAVHGEGKTTLALNLAISIAMDMNQTVLLVDLDLRKPCVHKYLGLNPSSGLTDYLIGNTSIPDSLLRLPFERLAILPSGNVFNNSSEILSSPKMDDLAHELKTRYPDRLIIYDMPPILTQDDSIAFIPHTDAVLMVIKEGGTRQDDVKRCLDLLRNAHVIGTVLNDCIQ